MSLSEHPSPKTIYLKALLLAMASHYQQAIHTLTGALGGKGKGEGKGEREGEREGQGQGGEWEVKMLLVSAKCKQI